MIISIVMAAKTCTTQTIAKVFLTFYKEYNNTYDTQILIGVLQWFLLFQQNGRPNGKPQSELRDFK